MDRQVIFGETTMHVGDNRLTPIVDGPARFGALLALIAHAQSEIRLYYYIFNEDVSGITVRAALLDAISRGVRVSLIVDGFGSSDTSDAFFEPLITAGCNFCRFIPRYGRRYLLRNHQKMAIADSATAIIGGFNISDTYFAPRDAESWHDLGLAVQGPIIGWLIHYYDALGHWARQDSAPLRSLRKAIQALPPPDGPLHWLLGGPVKRMNPWVRTIKRDLESARNMDMIQAYFSPGRSMLKRIKNIVRRGGQARIVTAQKSDNGTTTGAARFLYGGLLRNKVKVYEYLPSLLHMKLILIDDVTYIGSANFDMRSLFINMELMLRIDDASFTTQMRSFFECELKDCEQITPELHRERGGFFVQMKWMISWFIVTIMDYTIARRLNLKPD